MRVLILDHRPESVQALALSLRACGHCVVEFTDPIDALSDLGNGDVLVCDCQMPTMNGLQVAERAHEQGWCGPFFLKSGNRLAMNGDELFPSFLCSVLAKPFSPG